MRSSRILLSNSTRIVKNFQYVNLRLYSSISNPLQCEASKSVSLGDNAIKIRETVVSVSPEPVVIVTKSLIDIIPVPGIILSNIREKNVIRRIVYKYEVIKAAFLNYKHINDHMLVPRTFVIPADDIKWPAEEMWGMNLGILVNSIRAGKSYANKRADLESIGFDFNPQQTRYGYEVIKAALLKYKDINGNMLVPQTFVVPADDIKWPEGEMWGMNLGFVVMDIRAGNSHVNKREDLESIGFDFNPQREKFKQYGYEVIKAALLNYKDINDHILVPQTFVVPADDIKWPEGEMWGMNLGFVVMHIRAGKSHLKKRADLESIGFEFNPQQKRYRYEVIEAVLLNYKCLKGDMLVPRTFVVPADDIKWPEEEMWGMNLGILVNSIRAGNGYVNKREDLESIGFDFNPQRTRYGYEIIKAALLKYKDINDHMLVPRTFVVPADDIKWPEGEMWGMNLGFVVMDIRAGNSHVKKRPDLESIGFDYSAQEIGTESESERQCRKIFEGLFFPSIFGKIRPEWLILPITSEPIELDGYNEELKVAFEYQGEHHEKLSYFNNHDQQLLDEQQVRDRHKVSECLKRGITLIVIPSKYNYEDLPALRNFIISELKKAGKL